MYRVKNHLNYKLVIMGLDRTYFVPRVAFCESFLNSFFTPFGQYQRGNQQTQNDHWHHDKPGGRLLSYVPHASWTVWFFRGIRINVCGVNWVGIVKVFDAVAVNVCVFAIHDPVTVNIGILVVYYPVAISIYAVAQR